MNEQPLPPAKAADEYLRRALGAKSDEERAWNLRQAKLHYADHRTRAAKKKRRKIADASRKANRR